MTFKDIFKSSFLEATTTFSLIDTILALVLSFIIGIFIMVIYKKTFKGVMYSNSFCVSLLALTLITTLIILAVTSNVILSLGMVGALSIVRFRTAIKEPLDIAFLFCSISVGIVLGAGLLPLAIVGSIFIGITLILFVNKDSKDNPYILIINLENSQIEDTILSFIKEKCKKYVVKSKTISSNGIEFSLEIRLKDMSTEFINTISSANGVKNAILVSYNGDYMA